MIQPAPTSKIDATIARGTFLSAAAPTATAPAHIVVTFPNTNYELHLIPVGEGAPSLGTPGKRVLGRISARARRVDKVQTGGRFVEPVFGRPRRVQGSILAINAGARTITVDAGVPIECLLTDQRQSPAQFVVGDFVSFDVMDGATFRRA
ncbi:MAG: hypothetical protein AB7G11_00700 [Phycisphaerales bacterium]